ncbi:MAG: hypothetical protein GKS06_07990 [Acidobacteria bacterium]|nr:hypothetical protein [Acidobacteriota bacterium]
MPQPFDPIFYVLPLAAGEALPLYTYGVARGLAIIAVVLVWRYGFRRRGIDPDHAYMAFLWVAPITLLATAMFSFGQFAALLGEGADPWRVFLLAITRPGGSSLIAIPVGLLAVLQYARLYGVPTRRFLDVAALSAALALPIQRVGCSAAGCCYGGATEVPWAVTYDLLLLAYPRVAPLGVPIHPTQLYEAAATLALFITLIWMFRRNSPDGSVFWSFLGGYGAIRFAVDILRDDPHPFGEWNGLWGAHLIYAGAVLAAFVALRRIRRDSRSD